MNGVKKDDLKIIKEKFSNNDKIKYTIMYLNDSGAVRIKVNTISDSNIEKEAETLESIKNKIIKGEHRKDYKINVCYDGAAEYYCSKLMMPLAIFERKLRQLIYLILISLYGIEWINKLIPKEDISEFKTNNYKYINKFVEMGLECFTFQDYIDYLFEPRNPKNMEEIIEEVNKEMERNDVTKEDIVKIIKNNTQKTIWELMDSDNEIQFSKDYIEKIRDIRNKVAHNKEITSKEYNEYKEMLNLGKKELEIGIKKAEDENYIRNISVEIKSISDSILNDFKIKLEMINPIIDPMNKLVNTIYQVNPMNKLVNITNQMKLMNKLFTQENFSIIGEEEEEEKKENKNDYENNNN